MKLIIITLLTVFALGAEAASLRDILPILIGGGRPPGRPAPYPGDPYPGNPYPGQPDRPAPYPGDPYPGNPGGGYSCRVDDRGYEEHGGGHYSCGECLQYHGECIETCSSAMVECRVDGRDRYGSLVSFLGRGNDRWAAESDAIRACQYNYASNCYVIGCNQRQDVVSRRNCR